MEHTSTEEEMPSKDRTGYMKQRRYGDYTHLFNWCLECSLVYASEDWRRIDGTMQHPALRLHEYLTGNISVWELL